MVLEEYKKTLAALHQLLKRKREQGADDRQLSIIYEEIDEVAQIVTHLEKGEARYKWTLP